MNDKMESLIHELECREYDSSGVSASWVLARLREALWDDNTPKRQEEDKGEVIARYNNTPVVLSFENGQISDEVIEIARNL